MKILHYILSIDNISESKNELFYDFYIWNRTYIFHLVFRYLEWIKGPQLYQAFINLDRTACTRLLLFKMSRTKILQTLAIRLSRCESVLDVRL